MHCESPCESGVRLMNYESPCESGVRLTKCESPCESRVRLMHYFNVICTLKTKSGESPISMCTQPRSKKQIRAGIQVSRPHVRSIGRRILTCRGCQVVNEKLPAVMMRNCHLMSPRVLTSSPCQSRVCLKQYKSPCESGVRLMQRFPHANLGA